MHASTHAAEHARATPQHSPFGRPFSFISGDENPINDNVLLLHRFQPTLRAPPLSRIKIFGGRSEWKLFSVKLRAKFAREEDCVLGVCVCVDVVVSSWLGFGCAANGIVLYSIDAKNHQHLPHIGAVHSQRTIFSLNAIRDEWMKPWRLIIWHQPDPFTPLSQMNVRWWRRRRRRRLNEMSRKNDFHQNDYYYIIPLMLRHSLAALKRTHHSPVLRNKWKNSQKLIPSNGSNR